MKKRQIGIYFSSLFTAAVSLWGQSTFTLDDLTYYGSGSQRAAFVVDWKNGATNEVIAWGYRFDADMGYSVEQMMAEIAADSSSNLFIRWDSNTGFGAFVFGLGYQNGVESFDVTGAVDDWGDSVTANFQNGIWDIHTGPFWEAPAAFTGVADNSGDFYREGDGLDTAFWGLYVAGDAPDYSTSVSEQRKDSPVHWTASGLGISDTELIDEGWYGLGFGSAPSTVPEPGQAGLIFSLLAMVVLIYRRRR